jgi:hypothetical protein
MLVCSLAVIAGCQGRPGPIAPGPGISLSGTWSGTAIDSEAGEGTVRWVMTHAETGVSGSFTSTFPDPAFSTSGTLAGVITGTGATVFLMPAQPLVCSPVFSVTGTIYVSLAIGADRITGSYSTFTCVGGRAGTLVLTRQ